MIIIVDILTASFYWELEGHIFALRSYLCGDFVYVMLFPQLTLAVHAPNHVNTYGSIVGYFLGFLLRILGKRHPRAPRQGV